MYKKFVMGIAAMAALTLVSCSSDDLDSLSDNSSKNEAISFDGYLGRSAVAVNGTRGSVLDKTALQKSTEGFGVFGNYKKANDLEFGANLFNNQQVKYSSTDNKWAYENTKYWPTEGHIDFLAYAPYVGTPNFNGSSIDFTVENNVADQKDLLWANATNQTKVDNSGTNKVELTFNHALAKIGYTVKLKQTYSNATITLNKITLAGSADEKKNAFYSAGSIDLSKTSSTDLWTPSSTADKQNFKWFSSTQDLQTTDYSNPATDLFVIPQDFSHANGKTDDLYVIVGYTIKYTNHENGTISEMNYTVSSKIEKNFEQGKAYTLNLTIGLTPIEFNATVNGWGDIEDHPITLE